jgi:hypothetical protein
MDQQKAPNSPVFKILAAVVGIAGFFIALSILFPHAMSIFFNIIGVILFVTVAVFFTLGILVVIGLRKEANKILDILMEGSLSFVDFLAFLKLVWLRFLELLREFILYVTPVAAFALTLVLYTLLIFVYKNYGKNHDITIFTIILTATLVLVMGVINKPTNKVPDLTKWGNKVKEAFHSAFIDGLEVLLFVFFLTMDSTNLFFLPADLNIELKAKLHGYDFITRSFVNDGMLKITLNLIVFTITIEIIRNLLRVIAVARKHYTQDLLLFSDGLIASRSTRIKSAIRKSFSNTKNDLVKFITFNTVLFAVFLVFPRLKILTLAVASLSGLVLDIIMIDRLFVKGGNDLISRILAKVFKV